MPSIVSAKPASRLFDVLATSRAFASLSLPMESIPMPETVVHFQIRMPPVLHEQLASWAKEDKSSLNALIVGILEKAIEQHNKSTQAS
ncbi:HicB family protein [Planctomyces sp. SH-PL62]|nr:HicB family protein [Planctomyces sp. SH-PL62]